MPLVFPHPLGHWSNLIEGLQASPQECYAAIEEAVRRREIPDVRTSRITYKEAGPLSAERIYLRVEWRLLGFDICAARSGCHPIFEGARGVGATRSSRLAPRALPPASP
jgi:hypothetical protein